MKDLLFSNSSEQSYKLQCPFIEEQHWTFFVLQTELFMEHMTSEKSKSILKITKR